MSSLVFPANALGAYIASKEPYQDVRWDEAASGKEVGSTWQLSPRWKYKIVFEVLNGIAGGRQDLQQMLMLFLRHCRGDSFLLGDPEDSSVTDMGFGVGDGATTAFQLQRMVPGLITDAAGFSYTPQSKPYLNMLKDSSFEADGNGDGVADFWLDYNNNVATEPHVCRIVPGMNGGKAQRVSWGINHAPGGCGISTSYVPAWVNGQWYTLSYFARGQGGTVGATVMSLGWNNVPSTQTVISNPTLSANWQRYVFQFFWNVGATIESSGLYLTVLNTGFFGDVDFDLAQLVAGQHGVTEFQPFETPAGSTGTRTPSYWPSQADGFEPVYELSGTPTIYQDGDWQGRRQLYPYVRENILPFSEQIDNAAWSKGTGVVVTANAIAAPDGTTTAEQINEGTSATANHFVREGTVPSEVQGELRCYSVFVKANTLPNIVWTTETSDLGINFNLSTGVIAGARGGNALPSGVITSPLWPGWYRIWFIVRVGAGLGTGAYLSGSDGSYNIVYTGTSRLFYAWGAMCERASNLLGPTPYIRTPSSVAVTSTDYIRDSLGKVTPTVLVPSGAFLSWDGAFFKRVRLANPGLPLSRIVSQMWAGGLDLISQRPLP